MIFAAKVDWTLLIVPDVAVYVTPDVTYANRFPAESEILISNVV